MVVIAREALGAHARDVAGHHLVGLFRARGVAFPARETGISATGLSRPDSFGMRGV